jgi:HD-GYP domain-containing protein (c-di-GMP phosphodiesterase class II)
MSDPGVPLSGVLSGLSAALDITEGHPRGHAARTCIIAMRIAQGLGLDSDTAADLFYASLLKDAGCSANAERVFQMFGGPDEHRTKRAVWLRDWRRLNQKIRYALEWTEPEGETLARMQRLVKLAVRGPGAERELFEIRCARSAAIARALGFSDAIAQAVMCMDEHWDGGGHPAGLRAHDIPIPARIIGLAQVVEIFRDIDGPARALEVARERSGRWFDPEMVAALGHVATDELWQVLAQDDVAAAVSAVEPRDRLVEVSEERLDLVAAAFAWIIDAKSSFTFEHSDRVCTIALSMADRLGFLPEARTRLRRAALLHDLGKLAVPNAILDKPGSLTPDEWTVVKRHPYYTYQILLRVPIFAELADDAANHHERLDGGGYFRGLTGTSLTTAARVLAVADVADALMSARPYRAAMPTDRVLTIIDQDRDKAFCPDCVDVLRDVIESDASLRARAS